MQNQYRFGDSSLKVSTKEKDLGVFIDQNMKFSSQINAAVSSANATLGMIRRTVKSRSKNVIIKLYKSLVRPKLEYCVQVWRPYLKKDIDKIERVQQRATKMIKNCKNLSYEDRLRKTELTTLEDRRTRGDLIEAFKMMKGFSKVKFSDYFDIATCSRTRRHRYKLIKLRSKSNVRQNYFSQRIVNTWNNLPEEVLAAESVNSFKNLYDKYCSYPNK